ncbi:MAG TPA: DUF1845 domain-containing protein [Burkholderiaceae bacterium]|nr:DUF1845 domain-containing protein [Burkholderiaceae bacterium]
MSSDLPLAQLDSGRMNRRILTAKKYQVDLRGVEAASLKMSTRLTSAEAKRLLARCFYIYQKNLYNISSLGRLKLDAEEIGKLEAHLRSLLEKADKELDEVGSYAENLLKKNNIEELASYDDDPLMLEVGVISSLGARYLKLIQKMDTVMPLLQTLEISEIVSREVFERRRARCKRIILHISAVARTLAIGVRKRMAAVDVQSTAQRPKGNVPSAPEEARGAEIPGDDPHGSTDQSATAALQPQAIRAVTSAGANFTGGGPVPDPLEIPEREPAQLPTESVDN